jgi:hypothetical protein
MMCTLYISVFMLNGDSFECNFSIQKKIKVNLKFCMHLIITFTEIFCVCF